MLKLIIIETFFIFLLFLLLPSILISDFPGPANNPPSSAFRSLSQNNPYRFPLANPSNYLLNSLSLTLKNPLILNNSDIKLDLLLPDGSTHQSLSFTGANVGDPSTVRLKFLPASNLTAVLTTNNQLPETLFVLNDAHHIPVFSTTYQLPTFSSRITYFYQAWTQRLSSINPVFLISYLFLVIGLNYALKNKI